MRKKFVAIALSAMLAGSMCALTACGSDGTEKAEKQAEE